MPAFEEGAPIESEGWLEARDNGDDAPMAAILGWDAEAKARLAVADDQLDYGYSVALPNAAADVALDDEPHRTSFVN
jgi:hypothetical protein